MIKIKVTIPKFSNNINISQFVGNDQNIGFGCKFHVNDPTLYEADYWFVIEDLKLQEESVYVNTECVYFISAEVVHEKGYYDSPRMNAFLNQFSNIITCHDIYRQNTRYDVPFLPWMINANHGDSVFESSTRDINWLKESHAINKTKTISVICSNQLLTADHRLRFKFVNAMKKHFGETLDWFGNGINPLPKKWDGIAPYKYHVVIENQSRNNVITEKLYDSFLGMAYPIYYGAPNINNFFNSNSLTQIDIMDFSGSIRVIEDVLKEEKWERHRSTLIESKYRVLSEYNIFKRLAEIAKDAELSSTKTAKQNVSLRSSNHLTPKSFVEKLATRSGILIQRFANKLFEIGA
jgi:hypothetical protein